MNKKEAMNNVLGMKKYTFTNCGECENKDANNNHTLICYGCKRYYPCLFKRKEKTC